MTDVAVPVTRPRHRVLMSLGTLLLAVVPTRLILVLIEGVLRVLSHRALCEMNSKPSLFWRYDPLLRWAHEPGPSGGYVKPLPWPVEFGAEVPITSLGLRGPENSASASDKQRVLVLGDSMVAGFDVRYRDSFVAPLEGDRTYRFGQPTGLIDAGIHGHGTGPCYVYYTHRGRNLRPELVGFIQSGDDPADNTRVVERRRPFGKSAVVMSDKAEVRILGSPVPQYPICSEYQLSWTREFTRVDDLQEQWLWHLQTELFDESALFSLLTVSIPWTRKLLQRLHYIGNPHAERLRVGHGSEGDDAFALQLTTSLVRALARAVRQDRADLVVTSEAGCLHQLDHSALAAHGTEVLSLAAISRAPQRKVRGQRDSHLTSSGDRIVANLLLPELDSHLRKRAAGQGATR